MQVVGTHIKIITVIILVTSRHRAILSTSGDMITGEKVIDPNHPNLVVERALTAEERKLSVWDLASKVGQLNKKELLLAKQEILKGNTNVIVNIITIRNEGN